jgi:RNA polymerase sigma-70 factor (ECF subfamily)
MKHYERAGRASTPFDSTVLEKLAVEAVETAARPMMPLEVLESCLGKLSDADRMLIRRRYEPGSSVKELALDFGRSANSLSKSLGRIRRALLECIQRKLAGEC